LASSKPNEKHRPTTCDDDGDGGLVYDVTGFCMLTDAGVCGVSRKRELAVHTS